MCIRRSPPSRARHCVRIRRFPHHTPNFYVYLDSQPPCSVGFTTRPPPPKDTEDPAKFAKSISASQSFGGLDSYKPPPPPGEAPGAAAKDHADDTQLVIGSEQNGGVDHSNDAAPGAASHIHGTGDSDTGLRVGSQDNGGVDHSLDDKPGAASRIHPDDVDDKDDEDDDNDDDADDDDDDNDDTYAEKPKKFPICLPNKDGPTCKSDSDCMAHGNCVRCSAAGTCTCQSKETGKCTLF